MLALVLKFILVDAAALLGILGEKAVNHHIGITADRRCEMRVIIHCQTIVTDVLGGIDSLRHRTDGKYGEHVLLAASLHILEQTVERAVNLLRTTVGIDLEAETLRYQRQVAHLLGIWIVVHTVDERFRLLPLRNLAD